jgi:hypothetical protein
LIRRFSLHALSTVLTKKERRHRTKSERKKIEKQQTGLCCLTTVGRTKNLHGPNNFQGEKKKDNEKEFKDMSNK